MQKRRKVEDENRQFQSEWENLYFFFQVKENAICLICRHSTSIFKSYNLKRHFEQKHYNYKKYTEDERKVKLGILKAGLTVEQNIFHKKTIQSNAIVNASMRISHIIGKNMKPFSDGQYIKECLVAVAEEIIPKKVKIFSQISLSHQTVARRIDNISNEICSTLNMVSKGFVYFSLALDETTDIKDTAQLAIFIRGVDSEMNITEEFLDVISLKDTTTGKNIKEAVVKCTHDYGLSLANLIGITTDGAASMIGKNIGAVKLILDHRDVMEQSSKSSELFICHCFLHLENLCAQVFDMNHVMSVVIKTVNAIKNNSLKHRQFQDYLQELEYEYSDLLFYSKIRWLSRGKCLDRFWNLREEIRIFMNENDQNVAELYDEQWLLDLCFLTDITIKLNELNMQLQGENKLITDCYQNIKAFITKLKLYESQLITKNSVHFPLLHNFNSDNKNFSKYAQEITNLLREFQERFSYLKNYENIFNIFLCPFDIVVESAPTDFQMELIDLQSSSELKYMFESNDKVQFYKKYVCNSKFPNLRKLAMSVTAAMGTTYLCESFFSKLKIVKCKSRNRLTDENLKNQLRCATSKIHVDIKKYLKKLKNKFRIK